MMSGPNSAGRTPDREATMQSKPVSSLDLEVEEIESRELAFGNCTSSTTSSHCTCACFITTNSQV
jgi:hypothetical protein